MCIRLLWLNKAHSRSPVILSGAVVRATTARASDHWRPLCRVFWSVCTGRSSLQMFSSPESPSGTPGPRCEPCPPPGPCWGSWPASGPGAPLRNQQEDRTTWVTLNTHIQRSNQMQHLRLAFSRPASTSNCPGSWLVGWSESTWTAVLCNCLLNWELRSLLESDACSLLCDMSPYVIYYLISSIMFMGGDPLQWKNSFSLPSYLCAAGSLAELRNLHPIRRSFDKQDWDRSLISAASPVGMLQRDAPSPSTCSVLTDLFLCFTNSFANCSQPLLAIVTDSKWQLATVSES